VIFNDLLQTKLMNLYFMKLFVFAHNSQCHSSKEFQLIINKSVFEKLDMKNHKVIVNGMIEPHMKNHKVTMRGGK
jgi:hypothetical protein